MSSQSKAIAKQLSQVPSKQISIPTTMRTSKFTATNGSSFISNQNNVSFFDVTAEDGAYLAPGHTAIQFTIQNNNGATGTLDIAAWAAISRIRIIAKKSGQEIEDILNYNVLMTALYQIQGSESFARIMEVSAGVTQFNTTVTPDTVVPGVLTVLNSITSGGSATYTIPLLSGLFSGQTQYIDLAMLSGIQVQIYWDSNFSNVLKTAAAPSVAQYTILNPSIICNLVTIQDLSVRQMLRSRGVAYSYPMWQCFINSLPISQGVCNVLINDKSESLRSVMTFLVPTATNAFSGIQSVSGTTALNYQYKIGSQYYPTQAIPFSSVTGSANLGEAMFNTLSCLTSSVFSLKNTTFIDYSMMTQPVSSTSNSFFCFGMNLQSFNDNEGLESGLRTIDMPPLQLLINFTSANTTQAYQVLSFCNKDVLLVVNADGTLTRWC